MADFSIDYSNLYDIQSKLRALAQQADDSGTTNAFRELGDAVASERRACLGTAGLSYSFNSFFHHSKTRTSQAKDGLTELADTFKAVSDVFFDADSQISGAAGLLTSSLKLDQWKNQKAAYDAWAADKAAWDAYLAEIGATDYFRDHPDATIRGTCHADNAPSWCAAWTAKGEDSAPPKPGDAPPKPPDKPPTSWHYQDKNGTIDVKVELDKDNNIIKETQSITNPQGQKFETTTTYKGAPEWVDPPGGGSKDRYDVRDYTITTTFGDGTSSTSEVVINQDGTGKMTVTGGDKTEHYIRNGPKDKWIPDPAYAEDDDPDWTASVGV
ncbi:serine/arginine repetitive matrix protein 2 [Streptodolium elevatio]|uniref:Serine/arginine repetitive matrix protein 2 n=1 Tax=Streptodolium elevatio TaxID=3157996 RepID=A0ABV3DH37_9ACTN